MILKTLRLDRGLTQQALCEQIGVTKSVYARYEHDEYCPSTDIVVKIARFYGISIESLLGLPEASGIEYPENIQKLIQAGLEAEDFAVDDAINLMERHKKDMEKRRLRKEDQK